MSRVTIEQGGLNIKKIAPVLFLFLVLASSAPAAAELSANQITTMVEKLTIGAEVRTRYENRKYLAFLGGYSHFFIDSAVRAARAKSKDADFAYIQVSLKF